MSSKPNFFIIGAPKCGTTSLSAWLAEHPNIFMSPIKEPFYFSNDIKNQWVKTWDAYLRLFAPSLPNHLAIGEGSTSYLFSKVAVSAIEETLPNARYIVMLRYPVDMAYSLHEQQLRSFNETENDFSKAWRLAPERRAGRHIPPSCKDPILLDYPTWCLLGEQLTRLYNVVPKERVLVLVLDDMKANPGRDYLRVLEFLNVTDDARQNFPVYNPAREWRSVGVGKAMRVLAKGVAWSKHIAGILPQRSIGLIDRLQRANARQRQRPPMPPDIRSDLESFFAEDIQLLEHLLGREFPEWHRTTEENL